MAIYKCQVCGYEYNEETEGKPWSELDEDWQCDTCGIDKSFFDAIGGVSSQEKPKEEEVEHAEETLDTYLKQWSKSSVPSESSFADIHQIAKTGHSVTEPMKTTRKVISWDDVIIKGAQLHKLPLNSDVDVSTKTVIGVKALQPLVFDTPIYISHMSYGALSKEFKIALAKGSAAVRTCICSGEGGILPEEKAAAYKYIFEYVPNQYSVTEESLKQADAIEIKIGQGTKPGMGGHLPGDKVTEEIAKIRQRPQGESISSPSSYADIKDKEGLKKKVDWLREISGGRPIGVKIAAGNIEKDMDEILFANPDFITIDGRAGATGSAPKFVKDNTTVPTLFALYRASKYLKYNNVEHIALIITGGLRISPDFAKAIALGATAVAIASSAMIAGGCQQYRICHTGNCPMGIATQDPKLRERIDIDLSAQRLTNFLNVSTEELKTFSRITGNDDVHKLDVTDLETGNSEISDHTDIAHF